MPVEQLPGFWDYMSQGLDKFDQTRRANRAEKRQGERDKASDAQANAGLMTQLFGAGAVGSSALQGSVAATGARGADGQPITVMPSKAERRKAAMAAGPEAIAALPDYEQEELGFKTAAQKKIEGANVSAAELQIKKMDALGRFMAGDDLPDEIREVIGVSTKSDRELKKLTTMDPYLGALGERHVAGELLKNQGRIPKGGGAAISENAYANYVAERSATGAGALTPEQVAYTRSYFQRATQNALIQQHKMDLDQYQAESQRIGANASSAARGDNTSLKWFGQINNAMESVRKQQNDLMRANPALGPSLDNPALATSPMIKGAMERYMQLEQTAEAFRGAQGSLAEGNVPGNLAALLEAAGGMVTPPPAAGAKPGAAAAAPAAPAGAPAGGTPGINPDPVEATAQLMASGQVGDQHLQAYVLSGAITQEQVTKIKARAAKIQQEKLRKMPAPPSAESTTMRPRK